MARKRSGIPEEMRELLLSIRNKRAKVVIDHILQDGFITTEELEKTYHYSHPPRAARDVREAGIPLETFTVKSSTGKSIAAYRFGDLSRIRPDRISGRRAFPKGLKTQLYAANDGRCSICCGHFETRYLQIDHRVPYEVAGDVTEGRDELDQYMLLCGSCNRAKSWSCEHCVNWHEMKDQSICRSCYWGNPLSYEHIAMQDIRRLDVQWEGEEVRFFDRLNAQADAAGVMLPDFVKQVLQQHIRQNK